MSARAGSAAIMVKKRMVTRRVTKRAWRPHGRRPPHRGAGSMAERRTRSGVIGAACVHAPGV